MEVEDHRGQLGELEGQGRRPVLASVDLGGERRGPVPPAAGEDVELPIPRVSRLLDKRGKKQTSGAAVVLGFLVMSCGSLQIYRKR